MSKYIEKSAAAQAAYAGLAQAARPSELHRSVANVPGGFAKKIVKGRIYWYHQVKSLDGKLQQMYVGPDDAPTRSLIKDHQDPVARNASIHMGRLCRAAMALGCDGVIPKHARVLHRLADYGLFRAGAILVGTHAYLAYQNVFGVSWCAEDTTAGMNLVHLGKNISLALPSDTMVVEYGPIESLKMGFLPVVDRTRYTKAVELDFDLDFLTSLHQGGDAPVPVPRLNVTLQPLKFMEFCMEDPMVMVLLSSTGPIVVNAPRPERYGLAKLLVHGERRASQPEKASKDLEQAATLIDYLSAWQPEELQEAWAYLLARGPEWRSRAQGGIEALGRLHPGIECAIRWPNK